MLDQESKFWTENRDKLIDRYYRRYIVIVGNEVIGDYAKASEARKETIKTHKPDTFLIKFCKEDEFVKMQSYHDRRSWSWIDIW